MSSTSHLLALLLLLLATTTITTALIPQSPDQQTRRAIASLRDAITSIKTTTNKQPARLYLDYLIPLPPATKAEDIDPWPGGLAQMYPYAEDIVAEILRGVVNDPVEGKCSSQVLSAPDCCGLFIQESQIGGKEDVAAILFPGPDQLDTIEEVNAMVGDSRTLIIVNRQFKRPADFGLNPMRQTKSKATIFDKFEWGFAFQEFACRGEDTKLTFEYAKGWQTCVICDDEVTDEGGNTVPTTKEIDLLAPQQERPVYSALEDKINQVLPDPLWMRKMQEAKLKGFKFQRGKEE